MQEFEIGDVVKLVKVPRKNSEGNYKIDKEGNLKLYTRYNNGSRPEKKPLKILSIINLGDYTFYTTNSKKQNFVTADQIVKVEKTEMNVLPVPKKVRPVETFLIGLSESEDDRNFWY